MTTKNRLLTELVVDALRRVELVEDEDGLQFQVWGVRDLPGFKVFSVPLDGFDLAGALEDFTYCLVRELGEYVLSQLTAAQMRELEKIDAEFTEARRLARERAEWIPLPVFENLHVSILTAFVHWRIAEPWTDPQGKSGYRLSAFGRRVGQLRRDQLDERKPRKTG